MSRRYSKAKRNSFSLMMALMVFVYPVFARAVCPCPSGATQQTHAKIHHQELPAQNADGQSSCHGEHHNAGSSSPADPHHSQTQKGCCAISAADFALIKVDLNLNFAKQQLEKIFFSAVFLYAYISGQSLLDLGGYQRYGPSQDQSVKTIPLYTQYQSFLI